MAYTLSLMNPVKKSRPDAAGLRVRSVIPGRQRWDVGVVLGRPGMADLLEAGLRDTPGVDMVRVNPVTGRLLLYHDTGLSQAEADQMVRSAVFRVFRQATDTLAEFPVEVELADRPHTSGPLSSALWSWVVAGGAVAAAVVTGGVLVRSPLARLGAVAAATVVVVWRAWHRSRGSHQDATAPWKTEQNPLIRMVGSYRRKMYLASVLSALGQILDMMPALSIGVVVSLLIVGENATLASLGLTTVSAQLWFWCTAAAVVAGTSAVVSFAAGKLWRDLAQAVRQEWRTGMYAHIQRVQLEYLEGEQTSRLARILLDDVDEMGRFFTTSSNDLVQLATSVAVVVPVFLIFAPGIAWIAFLPIPVIAWFSFRHQKRSAPQYAASAEDETLLAGQLINNLQAGATVRSFGAEAYEIDRIDRLSQACRVSNRRVDTTAAAYPQLVRGASMMSSFVGLLLLGGRDVLAGVLSFEVFNALLGLPMQILLKLPTLGGAVDQYQRSMAALHRVRQVSELPVESTSTGQPLPVVQVRGELVFDRVSFAYPGRPPVLENLSLRIGAGQTVAIVGVSGAGKTTLAKLLLRFYDVSAGRILLDGRDIRQVRLTDLRAAIGFVSQDAFLTDGTIRENISYGTFGADPDQVAAAAQVADAEDFIQTLPARYDTRVGERGAMLSGGQRQRISLARVIVKDAPILILDEATSAVDNDTEAAIHRALTDFARGCTMIVIAHRLSTIRHAHRIYVLGSGGTVLEQGTHEELLVRDGVYASLWRRQIGELAS